MKDWDQVIAFADSLSWVEMTPSYSGAQDRPKKTQRAFRGRLRPNDAVH